jgi:TPR repeat protein
MPKALLALLLASLSPHAGAAADSPAIEAAVAAWAARDFVAAERELRALALARDPAAMTLLGVMAARGLGRPADPATAAAWFIRASRMNYRPAQLALARAYREGAGVPQDLAAAGRLEAAARGN